MATKIGINGFGRIGRQVFKAIQERFADELEVVAVNDLADNETLAHLLKYDSIYGKYDGTVEATEDEIIVDGQAIQAWAEPKMENLKWGDQGIDIVLESTGLFADFQKASTHISVGGAKKVLISAPAKGEGTTVVLGVNHADYDAASVDVVSNASCTTNCLAPMCKVLHDKWGIVQGMMTTIHSYTNDQRTLDLPHKDLRRARAAAINMIPTTTGAAKAIGLVIPDLKGKMDGCAVRIPTPTGSLTDLTVELEQELPGDNAEDWKAAVNAAYETASCEGDLVGYLKYTEEPIVLTDIQGDPASCILDAGMTYVMGGKMVKVGGWYDNEWGYSNRSAELIAMIANMM